MTLLALKKDRGLFITSSFIKARNTLPALCISQNEMIKLNSEVTQSMMKEDSIDPSSDHSYSSLSFWLSGCSSFPPSSFIDRARMKTEGDCSLMVFTIFKKSPA